MFCTFLNVEIMHPIMLSFRLGPPPTPTPTPPARPHTAARQVQPAAPVHSCSDGYYLPVKCK